MPDTSNLRDLPSPAHTELQNMLRGALYVEDAPQAVVAYLIDLRNRGSVREPNASVTVLLFHDGNGTLSVGGKSFGGWFKPLGEAFAEAEEWLSWDVVAEVNATLGLLPDGRVPPRLVVVERDPRDPDPTKDGIFRDHRCARCADGSRLDRCPTPNRPGNCGYPHARND